MMETEKEKKLHFLDTTLINQGKKIEFDIYRKPTTTDHLIRQNSCHPYEHKIAGKKCLINQMESYTISHNNKEHEKELI